MLYDVLANSLHQTDMVAVVELSPLCSPVPPRIALIRCHVTADRLQCCKLYPSSTPLLEVTKE
jgi:hypothetical protein